jgi:hypothetical protein
LEAQSPRQSISSLTEDTKGLDLVGRSRANSYFNCSPIRKDPAGLASGVRQKLASIVDESPNEEISIQILTESEGHVNQGHRRSISPVKRDYMEYMDGYSGRSGALRLVTDDVTIQEISLGDLLDP